MAAIRKVMKPLDDALLKLPTTKEEAFPERFAHPEVDEVYDQYRVK